MADRTAEALAHHVRLILDNDEALYEWRRHLARHADGPGDLSDALRDMVEELCGLGDMDCCMVSELLTTAIAHVDWYAMAQSYLAEED